MKQKLSLTTLMLVFLLGVGASFTQAQTTTVTTTINTSTPTHSNSYWNEFWNWLNNFTITQGNSSGGGGNCPLRICSSDPDPK